MSRRAKKLPSVLRDYEFKLQEEAVGQARGPSIVISACRLIMHSLRCLFVCIAAKPAVSIVFTDDGVRKTVSERKFQQLTEEDGSCPNPNVVYEGQKLFCWHTPSKTRFPCIVLRVDWKNDDTYSDSTGVGCKRKLAMDRVGKNESKQGVSNRKKMATVQLETEREEDAQFLKTYTVIASCVSK
jgi:hypothetical protein